MFWMRSLLIILKDISSSSSSSFPPSATFILWYWSWTAASCCKRYPSSDYTVPHIPHLSHDHQVIHWNNPCHKNHMTKNVITPARLPLVSLIIFINIHIIPLIDSNHDGFCQYNFHFWNRSYLLVLPWGFRWTKCSDQWQGKTQHNNNVN